MTTLKAARLENRSVCRISGHEARTFLQGLLTQDVLHLSEGQGAFSALLTPQGKILFDFFITPQADGFLIDCPASAAAPFLKRLKLYKLRAKISLEACDDLHVAAIFSEALLRADDDLVFFVDPRLADLGERVIGNNASLDKALSRFEVADADAYGDHRRKHGVPEFGEDFNSEESFLLDVNYDALNGVSYKKGCFVGQEVTSRMKRKGEIRKRVLLAQFDGEPPERGTPLTAGGSTLGEVLSGGERIALALIRLNRLKTAQDANTEILAGREPVQIMVPRYLKQS